MSAPTGFNENASLLPDPGANAVPIHVMRGGGKGGNSSTEDDEILKKYGMGKDGPIEDRIPPETRAEFIKQIKSGVCSANTGDSVILNKDCWAVLEVIRELINVGIQKANGKDIVASSLETSMAEFKNVIESQPTVSASQHSPMASPEPTHVPIPAPLPSSDSTTNETNTAVSELQKAFNIFKINVDEYNKLNSTGKKNLIHKTYKKLALEKHPNKGGITEDFQKLQDAYSVLKNNIVEDKKTKNNTRKNKAGNGKTPNNNSEAKLEEPITLIENYAKTPNSNSEAKLEEPITLIENYVKAPINSEAKLEEPIAIIENYVKAPNKVNVEEPTTPGSKATEKAKAIINNYLNPKTNNVKIENIQNTPFEKLEANATLNRLNDTTIKAIRQSMIDSKKRLLEINSLVRSTADENELNELNEEKNIIEELVHNWESILKLKDERMKNKKGGKTRRRLTRKKSKRSISKKRSKY